VNNVISTQPATANLARQTVCSSAELGIRLNTASFAEDEAELAALTHQLHVQHTAAAAAVAS
jgi:hypothetical protein